MLDRIAHLKSMLITTIETQEAHIADRKRQYRELSAIYQDAAKAENLVTERYAELERGIEDYRSGICPHCGENAELHLASLKKQLAELEPKLRDKHEEAELLAERLFDLEIDINELETKIHEDIRHNQETQKEICYLQLENQSVAA